MAVIDSTEALLQVSRDPIGFPTGPIWYRGHADAGWKLVPPIFRHRVAYSRDYEANLANEFLRRAGSRSAKLPEVDNHLGWLHLMQHYRCPTRLLDWTASIFAAAFFAVEDEAQRAIDGQLHVLNGAQMNRTFIHALQIARPAHSLVRVFAREAFDATDVNEEMPDRIRPAVALYPGESDLRMLAQQAACTIHNSNVPLEEWSDSGNWLARHIIPAASKEQIARDLLRLGVSRSALFPDLESLSLDISSPEYAALHNLTEQRDYSEHHDA